MTGVTSTSSTTNYSTAKGTTSFDGITSGINTTDIVNQLVAIDARQQNTLKATKQYEQNNITIWKQITANLLSLKMDAYSLSRDALYTSKTVNSTDTDVLTATVSGTPIDGSYQIVVNKLAQANQMLSNGYEDQDKTYVGTGTINFEFGKGFVSPKTKLDFLNGQQGIYRGSIKITDRNNSSATIDLSTFTEVQEVLDAINKNGSLDVTASINSAGNGINIVGNTGSSNIKIEEVNGGTTAADLGIKSSGAASIAGSSINYISTTTKLNLLNDGNGVRTVSGNDLLITKKNGTSVEVDLSSATKISDVITAIQTADAATEADPAKQLGVSLVDDGKGNKVFQIVDNSGGMGDFVISSLNGSKAAEDLGIVATTSGDTVTGDQVNAGIDTVLLKNMHGGSGVDLSAAISMTLHDGSTYTVNSAVFNVSKTLQEFVNNFNGDASAAGHFRASLNDAGNGIKIEDLTTGNTNFSITSNATTNSTTGFGISTDGVSTSSVKGANLELKYISDNTLLSSLNAGDGVTKGIVKFTNKVGNSVSIDFSADYITTMGDVISKINSDGAAYNISAAVNSTGDGLLITDSSGGSASLVIDNSGGGSFATDLNIKGSSSTTTLDGAFEFSITVASTDKLADVRDKINNAGLKVRAAIINDGSSSGSYKLMMTSKNTGEAGQISMDINVAGGEGLNMKTIATAQNAVFTLGSQGIGATPTVLYKSSNTITDVLSGVNLQLKSVSASPITISLANDYESIQKSIQNFTDTYNAFMGQVNDLTGYDAETKVAGALQGNYTINQIKNDVFSMLTNTVDGADPTVNNIGAIGLSFGLDGSLNFDTTTFMEVAQKNLDGVKNLFTYSTNVAQASYGSSATASAAESGYSASGAIDGNTSYEDFNASLTGWKASGGTGSYLQIVLGDTYKLQRFDLYTMDTSGSPASSSSLKSFDFDYWDSGSSSWVTEKTYSANSGGRIVYYFSKPIITDQVRLNNVVGNDEYARVTEFQVYESRGVGKRLDDLIAEITDSTTGSIASETDSINTEVTNLEQQISMWDDRLAVKATQYREKFNKMEAYMSQVKATGTWLGAQITAMTQTA